jgi:hypothetical protein
MTRLSWYMLMLIAPKKLQNALFTLCLKNHDRVSENFSSKLLNFYSFGVNADVK